MQFQYKEDFQQLIKVLMRNGAHSGINFRLREEDFFTHPIEGEKRWWLEVKLQILEENLLDENLTWESSEHCISQICLTRGHPSARDYIQGLIFDPQFQEAWSCRSSNPCYNYDDSCVKCYFLQKLSDNFQERFDIIFESPIESLFEGVKAFKLLQ